MIKLAAIADDLTGANDTALQFAKRNMKSCVKINFTADDFQTDKDVIVIDSDSRDLDASSAYTKVKKICESIKKYDAHCIYKKIDSTLRGNIGAEIKAMDDVFKPEVVLIAPAYPINKRITIGGYHLLCGVPLELTEIANSPKTPVKESYIPNILKQQAQDKEIGVLEFSIVKKHSEDIRKKIKDFLSVGINWIVCDVVEEKNFMTIMDAVKSFKNILWVGSAGLADYITYFYNWVGEEKFIQSHRNGSVLICAGSISRVTQKQIQNVIKYMDINFIKIDIPEILENKQSMDKYIRILEKLIWQNKNILLTTAINDEDVKKAVDTGKKYNLSSKEVSEQIANIMASIVSSLDLKKLAGMILTGGDIAVHICKSIGADSIEIISEIDTSIPLGYIKGDNIDKLFIVTKAGAFGKPDAFIKSIKAIRKFNLEGE